MSRSVTRISLAILLAFVALNAVGGAIYGFTGAKDVPVEWLAGTPFTSYFIPSCILLVVVGGSHLFAAFALLRRPSSARIATPCAGAILLGWVAVQVAMIGYVSWLQPAMAFAAVLILVLARRV